MSYQYQTSTNTVHDAAPKTPERRFGRCCRGRTSPALTSAGEDQEQLGNWAVSLLPSPRNAHLTRQRRETRIARIRGLPLGQLNPGAVNGPGGRSLPFPRRPKRYDVLARNELARVPRRLLLTWERGCLAAPQAASSQTCSFVRAAESVRSEAVLVSAAAGVGPDASCWAIASAGAPPRWRALCLCR